MPLSWNEIKSRAMAFSGEWMDAADEASQAKPFWIAFFEIFGITDKRVATFELNVKKLGAAHGFVDLFWPGMLIVEHKSRGKNLDLAFQQALDYFPGLPERVAFLFELYQRTTSLLPSDKPKVKRRAKADVPR